MNDLHTQTIVGFDPGLKRTGYAVITGSPRDVRIVEAGVLSIPSSEPLEERLHLLYEDVQSVFGDLKPDCCVVEDLFSHYDRPKTAILMGHARGVILLAAGSNQVPVHAYLPTRVKKTITGSGRASKAQMQAAICVELGLDKPPEPHDVADALAIALCHLHTRKE